PYGLSGGRDGGVGVLDELHELLGEPPARVRRVRQRVGRVLVVVPALAVRVAHRVELLVRVGRVHDAVLAHPVGLTRRLDSDEGVATRDTRVGRRALADTGAGLVAPTAPVGPPVDPALVDVGVQIRGRAHRGGPVWSTPTVAG